MGTIVNITAYSGKNSPEFLKHLEAVQVCVKHKLSYPEETMEYFKGCVGGENLEDIKHE